MQKILIYQNHLTYALLQTGKETMEKRVKKDKRLNS